MRKMIAPNAVPLQCARLRALCRQRSKVLGRELGQLGRVSGLTPKVGVVYLEL